MEDISSQLASASNKPEVIPEAALVSPVGVDSAPSPTTISDQIYSAAAIAVSPFAVVTNNAPDFKYKYPEAKPTPPNEDDTVWNRTFTAADSRLYNKHGKNATNSKKFRLSGETRILALSVLAENKRKYFAGLAQNKNNISATIATNSATESSLASQTSSSNAPISLSKGGSSNISRDTVHVTDTTQMSISEKVKAEGSRNRKATSSISASNQGQQALSRPPTLTSRASINSNDLHSKNEKEISKRSTTTSLKKPAARQILRQSKQEDKSILSSANANHPSKSTGPSDSDSNDGGEYCICRGPDDHRMMVNCEGPCRDWYHCSCLGIDIEDAKELLDRYICPKCSTDDLFTTYKPMCRYFNISGCRKAAQIGLKPTPSMYCSEQHKRDFWTFVIKNFSPGPSTIGGILSQSEVASLAKFFNTRSEWHALGTKPKLESKEGVDPKQPLGLDYITAEEAERIELIHSQRTILEEKIELMQSQKRLLFMIHEHSKLVASNPKNEIKDICGYDNRLAMNEAQFLRWKNSVEGQTVFSTGVLGPCTEETLSIVASIKFPGEALSEPASSAICLKPRKKCKHNGWRDIHGSDYQLSINNYEEHKARLQAEEEEILEQAELREANKDYHSHNVTIQHF
ncbi:hypothetical protein K3495_g5346 [Podosphaera aphanis]|nr:hypothetical protein K3495_g5346 [Podosphaera aphanis]